MSLLYKVFFFYVLYYYHSKEGKGNETLVFVRCVLLLLANMLSVIIIYCLLTGASISLPTGLTRGGAKFIGLVSLIPFALFYLINRKRYKRKFIEFDQLEPEEKTRMDYYSRIYIYSSIGLVILTVLYPLLVKFALQKGG